MSVHELVAALERVEASEQISPMWAVVRDAHPIEVSVEVAG